MKSRVGLWIDHKKAIMLSVTEKGAMVTRLTVSRTEKQLRRTGSSPLKGSFDDHQVPADNVRKRAFISHLNTYYDAVIAGLREADDILILGPGEAKNELRKRLKKNNLDNKIAAVQTTDKMSDRQLAAHVQHYFAA